MWPMNEGMDISAQSEETQEIGFCPELPTLTSAKAGHKRGALPTPS